MPAARTMAATQTLCKYILVSAISISSFVRSRASLFKFAALSSARNDTHACGEWFGHREIAIHDLERKRRQSAGCGTVEDRSAIARIVARVMTGALENLLVVDPRVHVTARVWADRRIGDNTIRCALLRDANERCRIEPQQQHLVEARALPDEIAVHWPCHHRRTATGNILGLQRNGSLTIDRDKEVSFLGPFVLRLRRRGACDRPGGDIEADDRHNREKIAPRVPVLARNHGVGPSTSETICSS